MKVDVIISADDIKEEKIRGKVVVIIDVLRATSVMVTAMENGCKEIIPVKKVEEAMEIASKDRSKFLLGGERKGIKIDGFDFSNSPLEYESSKVKGRTLVMTTSNGTQAIKNCEEAGRIFIGALINGQAIAEKLMNLKEDVVFVNAGTNGQFSMDDFITSGYMISELMDIAKMNHCEDIVELSDIARTSEYIYNSSNTVDGFLKDATHYKRMETLGYFGDLKYCLSKNKTRLVPEYRNGIITIK